MFSMDISLHIFHTVYLVRNHDGATKNLACRDMQQFEFFTLSRMSLKLYTYKV